MDVLSQPRAASVPSGATVMLRQLSAWLSRTGADRFFAVLVAAFGVELAHSGTTLASWAGALLFGWPGIAGAAAGQLAAAWLSRGEFPTALGLALCLALPGVIAWLSFRHSPKIGRGLPNLRSYHLLVFGAILGSLLSAATSSLLLDGGITPELWTRGASNLVAILFLGAPLLLLADSRLRPWMAAIPGEVPARRTRRLDPEAQASAPALPAGDETVVLSSRSRPEAEQGFLIGSTMVMGLTLLVVPMSAVLPLGGGWLTLLYMFPILWAAFYYGLRGAVLATSASAVLYLTGSFLLAAAGIWESTEGIWGQGADFLVLSLAGVFVGRIRENEVRLHDELMESNRLLKRDLERVATALTQAVEAKDSYTEGHLRRVSEYAVAVGGRLGLRGHDLEMLHYASMLHDIGKIGVPEGVLGKRGPLDWDEAEIMRQHPEIGARLLEKVDLLRDAAPIVLAHQERYDGDPEATYPGYPRGIKGEQIPLGARIIAVVDAFDAMTTTRPYRAALPVDRATAELRAERGRQFDPKVVDAFLDVLAERPWVREDAWA